MTGRPRKYDSAAARQKAYRERQKAQSQAVTLQNCPHCKHDQLIDVTSDIPIRAAIDVWCKSLYICKGCWKAIAVYPSGGCLVYVIKVSLTEFGRSELFARACNAVLLNSADQKGKSQQ